MTAVTIADELSIDSRSMDELGQSLLARQRQTQRRQLFSIWLLRAGMAAAFILSWYGLEAGHVIDKLLISSPGDVGRYLVDAFKHTAVWLAAWATLKAAVLGLVTGSVAGLVCGALLAGSPVLYAATRPFITLMNALPRPALAPILILWFGIGTTSKVAVSFSVVFFVMLLNTIAGMASTDSDHLLLARSLRMTRWQVFWLIRLRAAVPAVVAGLRLGAVYSVLGVVVAEMVASYNGLGLLLVQYTNTFKTAPAFGILFILAVMASLLDQIGSVVQRRLGASNG